MGLHIDSPSHWQCIQEAYKIEELERNDAQMVHQTFSNFTMIADMPRIHWNVSLLHAIPQFSRPRSTGRLASCGLASRVVSRLSDYQAMLFKVKIGLLINVELNRVDSLQTNIYIYISFLCTPGPLHRAQSIDQSRLFENKLADHTLYSGVPGTLKPVGASLLSLLDHLGVHRGPSLKIHEKPELSLRCVGTVGLASRISYNQSRSPCSIRFIDLLWSTV